MGSNDNIVLRNIVLTVCAFALAAYALYTNHIEIASGALTFVAGLWMHSGRGGPPGGGVAPVTPTVMLIAIGLTACNQGAGIDVSLLRISTQQPTTAERVRAEYEAQALLMADGLEMKPLAAAPTVTSGRYGIYSLSADGLAYTVDGNGLTLKLHAAQSLRTSSSCGGLSSPAAGDTCYDTTATAPYYYSGAGWKKVGDDSLAVHLAGSETITGTKTFSSGPVINANPSGSFIVAKANGGTGEDNSTGGTANTFWARPNGSTGAASYRAIVAADVPGSTLTSLYASFVTAQATGSLTAGATKYLGPGAVGEAASQVVVLVVSIPSVAATLATMACDLGTAPGGTDTVAVTVQKSTDHGSTWSDTSITCTITGSAQSCTDTTHTPSSAQGDLLAVKAVMSGTAAAANLRCTFRVSK